jgi:hypothetical protein
VVRVRVATYDLGIHLEDVSVPLREHGAVKIIGYERGGKSTLAEVLVRELRQSRANVVHQNATAWIQDRPHDPSRQAASVDPELTEAISRLEEERNSFWVVDDAEVLLAYASDGLLQSIGRKILSGRFSMIMIRNRFVYEHGGWFNDREKALYPELPTMWLAPLPTPTALRAARTYYSGVLADSRAFWLATMSGGIPGLMSDLVPFAPAWDDGSPNRPLLAHVRQRRQALKLERPLRAALVRSLGQGILPPRPMLSSAAQVEIGALEIAGMVHPRYAQLNEPFHGQFWHLVAGKADPAALPENAISTGLELESIVGELGLGGPVATAVGLDGAAAGDLANAFACSLFCQRLRPDLVRPLSLILADLLGTAYLADVVHSRTGEVDMFASGQELGAQLLTIAGLT